MTIPTLVINESGISGPTYAEVLAALQADYQSIYGSDAVLTSDTLDGQLLANFAQAIYDAQQAAIAVFLAFSPSTAQGVGLSSIVKINGIARNVASNSTALVTITGTVGTQIIDGIVGDDLGLGTQWSLPALVTIPGSGSIDVTATCTKLGAITAAPNSLSVILTPTRGWQAVNNAVAASPGAPVETDAALRRRQAFSVGISAETVNYAIYAAVANVPGVARVSLYENDTDATDSEGVPSHSISLIVQGGDSTDIAEAIASTKTPGTGTFGTTQVVVTDPRGVPNTINYFVLSLVALKVEVTVSDLPGWASTTEDDIKAAVVAFINDLAIGEDSYTTRLYTPANLNGGALSDTYVVTLIRQAKVANAFGTANVAIAFNEAAIIDIADVTIIVV